MGYPLHGQDISLDVSPVQARLGWAVGWSKPAFWGKDVLVAEKEAGPRVTLRGLVAEGRGIARPQMSVKVTQDLPVGVVTSGTFSPTLRKGIALALVNSQIQLDAEVLVDVRGRPEVFVVTKPPFVEPGTEFEPTRRPRPTSQRPRGSVTNTPEPAFGSSSRKQDQVPWWWQQLDADGRVISAERTEFPPERTRVPHSQRRESWLGEAYPDLAEDGVSAVTLFEGDREVYGPMSLEAG